MGLGIANLLHVGLGAQRPLRPKKKDWTRIRNLKYFQGKHSKLFGGTIQLRNKVLLVYWATYVLDTFCRLELANKHFIAA